MSKILMFLLVFSFVGAIGAAVPADAVLSDFPRLAGETDDAPRFRRAISAAANGVLAAATSTDGGLRAACASETRIISH